MRQAGVSVPADDVGMGEAWDELVDADTPRRVRRPITGGRATADRPAASGGRATADRPAASGGRAATATATTATTATARASSSLRQPPSGPIAVNVADRYAKALALAPAPTVAPPPLKPRRSQAAMRDRALRPTPRDVRDAPPRKEARRPIPDPQPPARPASVAPKPSRRQATVPPPPTGGPPEPLPRASDTTAGVRATDTTAGASAAAPAGGVPGRRTVTIRGRGAERDLTWSAYHSRRRPETPAHERPGFKADRMALWAVLLGLVLVLVAAASSHAAVLVHAVH